MTELLPCPFCGEKPGKMLERPDNIDGTEFVAIISCFCDGYSACAHKMARNKTPEAARTEVIAIWNHRIAVKPAWPSKKLHEFRMQLQGNPAGDYRILIESDGMDGFTLKRFERIR